MSGAGKGSRSGSGGRGGSGGSRGKGGGPSSAPNVVPNGKVSSEEVAVTAPVEMPAAPVTRRRRFSRRTMWLTIGVVALVLIAGVGLYAWFTVNRPLPTINGTAKLPGLSANVTVTRDTYGVPHIVADNVNDLYMAQGYVHAQDRLYQMFFFRTAGQGRLAELFDPGLVTADQYLRIVGFRRVAEAEVAALRPEVREALEFYARGVNEFVHSHQDSLPLEFTLLGIPFEDWTPVDTVAFGKLEARDLTETWSNEFFTSDLIERLGPELAAQLLPGYPEGAPNIVPGANSGRYAPVVETYRKTIGPLLGLWDSDIGSNNWVVDGTKSATGKPLLANDPHLGVRNPSIWYEMHLSTSDGKYDASGFGFAGAPGIVTGHNKDIAWGVTNLAADVEDVFLEKVDPQGHPGQYLKGSNWVQFQTITETIKVKGGQTITQTVRITNHGPMISDAFTDTARLSTSITDTFSLQWTALEPGGLMNSLYDLQTASNWETFRKALEGWDVPGQNFVYADNQGNIGYQTTGKIPIRKKGDGSVPAIGWTGESDWSGYIPFDELPRAYNPPEHFIATANNQPYGDGYSNPFPGYYAKPWRIERIEELLKGKDKFSLDDMKVVQNDTVSTHAKRIAPVLAGLQPAEDRGKQAVEMLKGWDGNMKADSVPASIYEITVQQILTRTLSDELQGDDPNHNLFLQYLDGMDSEALWTIQSLMDTPDDPLWDNKQTTEKENRDTILLASLNGALADLARLLGDNMQDWTWGKLHQIEPRHEFSSAELVGGMFTLPARPLGGNKTTVAVAPYPLVFASIPLQGPMPVVSHQSYRMLLDTSDWTKSLGVFATGESGQPGSKFRENMYPVWLAGDYLPMLYSKEQIDASKEGVLTLTP
jgi:penicillin G amidase